MKINNKNISIFLSILFIIIFSIFNLDQYLEFHKEKIEIENINYENSLKLENFKLENIKELNDVSFYYTPYKELINKIVELIDESKKEIFLETYMLTETRTQEALIKAKKRWVNIKVILEKDPYMAYNINNKAFEKLEKQWINIVWSNKNNYVFNHSKILIIDDLSIISTWNYSYSTFTKNRDFFIFTKDENITNKLKQNFENDFLWKKINVYNDNLIFSPGSSRIKFEKLFHWAEKSIKMYFQYLKDDDLVEKLIKIKKNKNIEITIVIPETAKGDENIKKLKNNWIEINILSKYTMHAKAILIDDLYLFIWSINFSSNSIDKNREVGILIKNKEIINKFLNIFKQDTKKTY